MTESLKLMQDNFKSEISSLRNKAQDLEQQYHDLKMLCNTKVSGEGLAEIIDKKL